MTETPSGFPDPAAAGAPPADPNAPAAWGAPPPYAEPPKKKKRIWLRVILGIVGVIVLIGVIGVIVAGTRTRHHLTLKATAGGLTQVTPVDSNLQTVLTNMNDAWGSGATNNVSAQYGSGADTVLVSAVEIKTRFSDPDATAKNIGKALDAGTFTKIGGSGDLVVECAPGATDTDPTTCFWTDRDTAGLTLSEQTPDKAGPVTAGIAKDLEAK